jgi:hypothetical protein
MGDELSEAAACWHNARCALRDARMRLGAAYTNHPGQHRGARVQMLYEAVHYLVLAERGRQRAKATRG